MLDQAGARIENADAGAATDEAQGIYDALIHELHDDTQGPCGAHKGKLPRRVGLHRGPRHQRRRRCATAIHLGSTIVNDYGRPYENGFNNYSGASGYATARPVRALCARRVSGGALGRRLLPGAGAGAQHGRRHRPTSTIAHQPSPSRTRPPFPMGPIATTTNGRLMEAYVSAQFSTTRFRSASRTTGSDLG